MSGRKSAKKASKYDIICNNKVHIFIYIFIVIFLITIIKYAICIIVACIFSGGTAISCSLFLGGRDQYHEG